MDRTQQGNPERKILKLHSADHINALPFDSVKVAKEGLSKSPSDTVFYRLGKLKVVNAAPLDDNQHATTSNQTRCAENNRNAWRLDFI